ncbi:YdeI/OmpD-associated family protein [Alkalicoccobacillus plakortidis]|uniref:YdeI family protein n=1 Tax=Alkalicoccobacillus plakortidis TaxID=444060 RepID=A0ABT0XP59_9BACI|nr:YdeI family protein [Alkalicoccobacillus plakortidis]MCM2677505.1 YdeI family protein [Alkalicoccobacillus plakortidis]
MTNSKLNPKVDAFLSRSEKWREEFETLREIALDCELVEDLKWGVPCYTVKSKNVVLIHGFKEYCALLFVKGALLKDAEKLLIQQTDNVQAARQIRFTHVEEIEKNKTKIKAFIQEAIEVEKAGLKVDTKKNIEITIPEELQKTFNEVPGLETAFKSLTPGRQRAYVLHFSQAKQAKTREVRVQKYVQHILNGKGLND